MAATTTQFQTTKLGGPFEVVSIPKPSPGANEVSIRMKAVGLNPVDWKQLYSGVMVESWPTVFGIEGAGVVEAVGSGVTKFKAGDEVFSFHDRGGSKTAAYQEIAIVPERCLGRKPGNVSFEEAASLPICYCTAAAAIYDALKIALPFLPEGASSGSQPKSVLVLGGSSAVGAAAIQILRLSLPSITILATSSTQHHTHLSSLGVSKAFDQKSSSLVADIKSATPGGKGVDIIVDVVGSGAVQTSIFDTLSPDGPKEYAEVFTGAQFEVPVGVTRHVVFGQTVFDRPGGVNILPALTDLVSQGKYKVPVRVKTVGSGYDAIEKGLEELKGGVSGMKLVVTL